MAKKPTLDEMRLAVSKVMPHHQREANKAKFLEPSKVKDVMYHGTRSNIKNFRADPKKVEQLHSSAIFVTPAEDIANEFATKHQSDKTFSDFEAPPSKFPKGANILPVHVQAKNPFDVGNVEHYKALVEHLKKNPPPLIGNFTDSANLDRFKEEQLRQALAFAHNAHTSAQIPQDNYNSIERREIQDAIKQMGHDSFYVHEMGTKNLGMFNPNQIKSAIGNRGTYDINESDINKAQGGNVKYPSIEEMLQKLREAGRTPIVPAPNRWFADAEKHPFQQKMIEKVLAHTGQGREGFPSGSYINPQTGEPMDFEIMHDLGVAIDPSTGRPMMSGIRSDLTEIDPKLGSITKSNLVRKGLFKHEGGDQLLKDLAFLATIEKSGKGHHYGLSTEYVSPAELVNTMTGANPTLRPHSRGDIFGVGEEVGRISIQGKHHPVYEKLLVAPTGSHVQGKKLHKAKGGQVTHAHHLEIEERPL